MELASCLQPSIKSLLNISSQSMCFSTTSKYFPLSVVEAQAIVTGRLDRRETKQQLIRWPGLAPLGFCLVSLHLQSDIPVSQAVQGD